MKKAFYLSLALVFCGVFYSCEEPKELKEEKKEIKYTLISDDGIVYENFSEIYVYEFDKYNKIGPTIEEYFSYVAEISPEHRAVIEKHKNKS